MTRVNPRDLQRKRFQAIAATTLDKQAEAIHVTREYLADLAGRIDRVELQCGARLDRAEGRLPPRTVWARLRWLVRG